MAAAAMCLRSATAVAAVSTVKLSSSFVAARPTATPSYAGRAGRVCMAASDNKGFDLWIPDAIPPSYLDGSLPGDRGFDPLQIAANETLRNRFVEGEVINGRWAMLAVVGAIVPEILGRGNFGDNAKLLTDGPVLGLEPIGVPESLVGLAIVVAAFAGESFRLKDQVTKGYKSLDAVNARLYPGFDPLGLAKGKSDEAVKEWRTKEIKNGRLAMVAFVGFVYQYLQTGAGPIQNLTDHLSNPHANWLLSASQL